MKFSAKNVLALLLILIVIAAFFFPLFYPSPKIIVTPDFGQSDALSSFSAKYVLWQHLKVNTIPLWTNSIGGGFPFYAQGGMSVFFIPNLILYKLFDPVTAYNFSIILALSMIGWGMYLWLKLLKHTDLTSWFGGMTLALSGYSVVQLTHISIVQGLSVFPFIVIATLLFTQTDSWTPVAIFAFLLGEQLLIGFPQTVFITLLFTTAYLIWTVRKQKNRLFVVIKYGVGVILGIGLSAVQLLPSLEFLRNVQGSGGFSTDTATLFSFPIAHLKTLLDPFVLGNPKFGTYPPYYSFGGSIFWENTAFIGIVPLILIGIAIFFFFLRKKKKAIISPQTIFFISVLIISFLLMTGGNSPLYLIYSFWPFSLFRVPSRFIWLFIVSLTIVSVIALETLRRTLPKKIATHIIIVVIIIHTVQLFVTWGSYHAIGAADLWLSPPTLSSFIPRDGNLLTLGAENAHNQVFLAHGWQDMNAFYLLRNTLTPDKSLLWGIPNLQEYAGRSLKRSAFINTLIGTAITSNDTEATISAFGSKLLSTYAIKSVISTVPIKETSLISRATLTYPGHQINLFVNTDAVPPIYIATSSAYAATTQQAATVLQSPSFIPGSTVLLEHPTTYAIQHYSGSVSVVKQHETQLVARIQNNPSSTILVNTTTYYPGWLAYVDGKETPIFPVNVRQQGIFVPKGDHTIEFTYRPLSFTYGAIISAISLLITILVVAFALRQSDAYTRQKALELLKNSSRNHGTSRPHKA